MVYEKSLLPNSIYETKERWTALSFVEEIKPNHLQFKIIYFNPSKNYQKIDQINRSETDLRMMSTKYQRHQGK